MKKSTQLKLFNFWPPFWGAGIQIDKISDDLLYAEVVLKERPWNKNLNGTHYGGSIFSMTDPFFATMLKENLGSDYIVWDKAASIRFKKPGKGTLRAIYQMTLEQIEEVKAIADTQDKAEPEFIALVKDQFGDVIAEVDKVVYVKRRDKMRDRSQKQAEPSAEALVDTTPLPPS